MDVLMPQLGETVAEGKITQWFKSAGDTIKPAALRALLAQWRIQQVAAAE